jgi:hypothetical protein
MNLRNKKGYLLLETVASVAVIAIALVVILRSFASSLRASSIDSVPFTSEKQRNRMIPGASVGGWRRRPVDSRRRIRARGEPHPAPTERADSGPCRTGAEHPRWQHQGKDMTQVTVYTTPT